METIRNFCIIAHIDHGKSTLADRFLELTGALSTREMVEQVLDSHELEREKGITIKAHTVTLFYQARDGRTYTLNLIDTPGHVDFSYEVSRALAACEGAVLVVDATQGIEAQTVANTYLALEHDLEIIPVVNKIDLPGAEPGHVAEQLQNWLGFRRDEILFVSAKQGTHVPELLERIVQVIPPPQGDPAAPLQALIFDAWYDSYRGVVVMVRVFHGALRVGDRVRVMSTGLDYEVHGLGIRTPYDRPREALGPGEVGFVIAGIKALSEVRIGDTITRADRPAPAPLPGFRPAKPMVFASFYPIGDTQYDGLRNALEKLRLIDASVTFQPEYSEALGHGFRMGFLGFLHMEIVRERLRRDLGVEVLVAAPSVRYRVRQRGGAVLEIDTPSQLPPPEQVEALEEPYMKVFILTPTVYIGPVLQLCEEYRGEQRNIEYPTPDRVMITYEMPLAELMSDFYDRLKSVSRGYASMDYEWVGYRPSDLVRLDVLINGQPVEAFSMIVHRSQAYHRGRAVVERLRAVIPRHLFEVVLQASIGKRVIARERIPPLRKDVLAKCYGGDVTRKKKLLERQKEGKKRLKRIGQVDVPPEAFLAVLRRSN
ncbi:MAG: translation elongation factor 4 [Acidobacteria bacterium]|nr:translation elongation factor 4 [Acidobacteriota bacterium]MDW7984187.1 translation elongation factor 4 [Acidobacteriota bacterium]